METHRNNLDNVCRMCANLLGQSSQTRYLVTTVTKSWKVIMRDFYFPVENSDIHPKYMCAKCKFKLKKEADRFMKLFKKVQNIRSNFQNYIQNVGGIENLFIEPKQFTAHSDECLICFPPAAVEMEVEDQDQGPELPVDANPLMEVGDQDQGPELPVGAAYPPLQQQQMEEPQDQNQGPENSAAVESPVFPVAAQPNEAVPELMQIEHLDQQPSILSQESYKQAEDPAQPHVLSSTRSQHLSSEISTQQSMNDYLIPGIRALGEKNNAHNDDTLSVDSDNPHYIDSSDDQLIDSNLWTPQPTATATATATAAATATATAAAGPMQSDVYVQTDHDFIMTESQESRRSLGKYVPSPVTKIFDLDQELVVTTPDAQFERKDKENLKIQYNAFSKSKGKSKFPFKVKLSSGEIREDFFYAGNNSHPVEIFTSPKIAKLLICKICQKVPTIDPLVSICCEDIYCEECFLGLKSKTRACFNVFFGSCNKIMATNGIGGFKREVWENLEIQCTKCKEAQDPVLYSFHKFCCDKIRKQGNPPTKWEDIIAGSGDSLRKNLSKTLKKRLHSVRKVTSDLCKQENIQNESIVSLLTAKSFLKEGHGHSKKNMKVQKYIDSLIYMINNQQEDLLDISKLTPLQTAALRKVIVYHILNFKVHSVTIT